MWSSDRLIKSGHPQARRPQAKKRALDNFITSEKQSDDISAGHAKSI